jgi:hypothetical protein
VWRGTYGWARAHGSAATDSLVSIVSAEILACIQTLARVFNRPVFHVKQAILGVVRASTVVRTSTA